MSRMLVPVDIPAQFRAAEAVSVPVPNSFEGEQHRELWDRCRTTQGLHNRGWGQCNMVSVLLAILLRR